MNPDQVNIDEFVNYEAEYRKVIKGAKINGYNLLGRCPFHDDKVSSFSADIKTGKCQCFAGCFKGNFISFWAKYYNQNEEDTKLAYKQILEKYGRLKEAGSKKNTKPANENYTLSEYSFVKRLPEDFLKEKFNLSTEKDRNGTKYLKMPYKNEENTASIFRQRYANKGFKWGRGSAGNLILYGDWMLPSIREAGWTILVEGESDMQTLYYLNFPVLGVPGANNFNAKMAQKLQELNKIYIHQEPDQGGDTFIKKVSKRLGETGFTGKMYVWSCKQFGVKDPSELYLKDGQAETVNAIQKALKQAKLLDVENPASAIPETLKGAPVTLRQPQNWEFREQGIICIDERKGTAKTICRTPILLSRRLKNIDTGEEKIEIAFKRDGEWQTAILSRSVIFTARTIISLADLGCTITSENAKLVVRYLEALEADNIDVIKKVNSTSTYGWKPGRRFLPGYAKDIVLDVEPSLRGWANAYHTNGTLTGWKETMKAHRNRDKFRFILAASFVPPLLKIIKQRSFFIYNWANSKSGKTAALKAALSAWGDPDRLMINFNATQVALERMAGFFTDLPLGIDERQLAGKQQEKLEIIAYMISNGTGRARGSKGGGLQALSTWRTVALATGEESLSTDTTQTGVSTRILEIYGAPFPDEKSASLMHHEAASNCGWAGLTFIGNLLKINEKSIIDAYERMMNMAFKKAEGISGSHVSSISAVALADAMIDTWIFQGIEQDEENLKIYKESWERALQMAEAIMREIRSEGIQDINERATQFAVDWILSNRNQFGDNVVGTCLGFFSKDENTVYIYPTLFNQALTKNGYSARKTIKYLAENNIIGSSFKKVGKNEKVYSVCKWFNGRTSRFIEFNLSSVSKAEEKTAEEKESKWKQLEMNEDLPFDSDSELPY